MEELRFLFRFRDLVASTIQEHKRIIQDNGACWWGWWKRPSEDNRTHVWSALQEEVAGGAIASVGLFNSGNGKVYRAVVKEVIVPPTHAGHQGQAVHVPNDQQHLVPSYYRESPFSRAWMLFQSIDELDEFFYHYSFAEAPRLAGYDPGMLQRIKGKKIVTQDELRLMDTTIWEVRVADPNDPADQILLSTSAVSAAVSQEVIRCKSDEILHITDMHYALGKCRSHHVWRLESDTEPLGTHSMVEAISHAIGARKIGLVIASGDFTFVGSSQEFDEAASAMSHLLGILDLSPDHLVVIPGNHDIQWTTDEIYKDDAPVTQASGAARRNYESFYERLMRHKSNRHLAMGRRFVLPSGVLLEVCGLNSSSLAQGPEYLAGMGRIVEGSFSEVCNELGWQDDESLAFRLLVTHHHLALTEDIELTSEYPRGFGIAVDAVRVQRMAARKGVHLVLHGHKHRAFLWRSSVYELPEHSNSRYKLGDLSIVGGGSAGSIDGEGNITNFFNILSFSATQLQVEIQRAKNAGSFDLMQKWKAHFEIDHERSRLTLTDFTPWKE